MLPHALIDAIVNNDHARFSALLAESPELAVATVTESAFIEKIRRQIYSGDTALHIAAAAYRAKMAKQLIDAGADPGAKNRRRSEPLHLATEGSPLSNPKAQVETIACLIEAGANPNAQNMDGATPLHRAVRSRCAEAVKTLLDHGADPTIRNKNGSTPAETAQHTTGRRGTGRPEAKAQQEKILLLLYSHSIC